MLMNKAISDLQKTLTSKNVLTEIEERYAYSQDASNTSGHTHLPDVVVFAENIEHVQNIIKIANKYKLPVICRGAGTNTGGAGGAEDGGVILNFSKMNKILEINRENMTARVQPGVIVGVLQNEVEKLGLFYPPDPSNLAVSTIGGSIAQNSAGARTFKYGSTKDYVIDMLVVTAQGELLRTGSNTIKNATGYNLGSLFIGSEGTLGIVVEATLKLIPKPQCSKVIMAYFDDLTDAANAVTSVIEQQIAPATIDFMDKNALRTVEQFYPVGLLTDKEAALIIEIDGYKSSIEEQKDTITKVLRHSNASAIQYSSTDDEARKIWQARRSSMGACAKLKPNITTDDVIVPRENLPQLVKGIQEICNKYKLTVCMVGHVGDGSVHPQIPLDFNDKEEYKNYKLAKSEIYDLTIKLGGTLSGEHGIGREKRAHILKAVNSTALNYMREIKKIFDPNNILNPYKIF